MPSVPEELMRKYMLPGQVVHIDTECERNDFSWVRGLNSYLEPTVAVRWAQYVPESFHARFSAVSRTYQYWISNEPVRSPFYWREERDGFFVRLMKKKCRKGPITFWANMIFPVSELPDANLRRQSKPSTL